ncbi:type VII secretion protein EssB [Lactobacillus sp. PV034]|uniref:type VII secretion protein EssB n=1 Tax=Lactobacillus sp. PV034 TaxID=2594495 RepID=UPI0022403AE5|nr:type VII secretion protein EssB [Lactobacillus sp. PV034]QNQ80162.1 type VII secretion protein EssB [Lactobacillus sp. PV034]
MPQISDGFNSIEVSKLDSAYKRKVILTADQFHLDAVNEYKLFLGKNDHYFAGEVVKADEDQLELSYQLSNAAIPLPEYVKDLNRLEILQLISHLYWLVDEQVDGLQPFISPDNLYVMGDQVVVMHRGFSKAITPEQESADQRVKQFKALIHYLFNPKLNFTKLVGGSIALNNTFGQTLAKLDQIDQIKSWVNKNLTNQIKSAHRTQITIKKSRYQLTRWVAIVASLVTTAMIILALVWGFYTLPKQNRIIKAQSDYLNNDYSAVVDELNSYQTKSLPQSARFVLAVSYINLDDLSKSQKQAVLKSISQKSSASQLNYWIELGRANYSQALSIAQNIGDNEYILHAYTKLYTATKNNTTMNGSKKQSELNKYRKQINKYIKKLGGAKNEFEGN